MSAHPAADEVDSGREHDRELVRDVLAMTPRERLEELAQVEEFFGLAQRMA